MVYCSVLFHKNFRGVAAGTSALILILVLEDDVMMV